MEITKILILIITYNIKNIIATTGKPTTTTSTTTRKPGVIGICNGYYGFSISQGVTICNRDSYGLSRNASEVNYFIY